jgi:hypothetical protein
MMMNMGSGHMTMIWDNEKASQMQKRTTTMRGTTRMTMTMVANDRASRRQRAGEDSEEEGTARRRGR